MSERSEFIYKIAPKALWEGAKVEGLFTGAPIDKQDGFIHFSTAAQVKETAAKHFAGQDDLLLLAIDPAALGEELKFEVSRGGDLFPHLYAPLKLEAVVSEYELRFDAAGNHIFPENLK